VRRLLAIVALLSITSCATMKRHPSVSIIAGATAFGGIAVGLPVVNECVPNTPDECGLRHDAAIVAGFAAAGALVGVWLQHEWTLQDSGRKAAKAEEAARKKAKPKP
jgi:hypothetical protein